MVSLQGDERYKIDSTSLVRIRGVCSHEISDLMRHTFLWVACVVQSIAATATDDLGLERSLSGLVFFTEGRRSFDEQPSPTDLPQIEVLSYPFRHVSSLETISLMSVKSESEPDTDTASNSPRFWCSLSCLYSPTLPLEVTQAGNLLGLSRRQTTKLRFRTLLASLGEIMETASALADLTSSTANSAVSTISTDAFRESSIPLGLLNKVLIPLHAFITLIDRKLARTAMDLPSLPELKEKYSELARGDTTAVRVAGLKIDCLLEIMSRTYSELVLRADLEDAALCFC